MLRGYNSLYLPLTYWLDAVKHELRGVERAIFYIFVHAAQMTWGLRIRDNSGSSLWIKTDCGKTTNPSSEIRLCRKRKMQKQLDAKRIASIIVPCKYRWVSVDWASDLSLITVNTAQSLFPLQGELQPDAESGCHARCVMTLSFFCILANMQSPMLGRNSRQ